MKKTIVKCTCDICKEEVEEKNIRQIKYPVIFHTDQTEGRGCDPYISYEKIDICNKCVNKVLKIDGRGAQGYNKYELRDEE